MKTIITIMLAFIVSASIAQTTQELAQKIKQQSIQIKKEIKETQNEISRTEALTKKVQKLSKELDRKQKIKTAPVLQKIADGPVSPSVDSVKISAEVLKSLFQMAFNGIDASPDITALQAREGKKQIEALYKQTFPDPKPQVDTLKKP